jgi:hypothetical protein
MPITHRDIPELAQELMRDYGDRAASHAAEQAEACIARGDMEGAYHWRRVIAHIQDLADPQSESVH